MTTPWTDADKLNWFREQTIKRSYAQEVVPKIQALAKNPALGVSQYGEITVEVQGKGHRYPLYLVQSRSPAPGKKTVLITGGVHGYETSGVHGALSFLERHATKYAEHFNLVCAPCISPWAYETINRWNSKALDPNRNFFEHSAAEECAQFLKAMAPLKESIYVHIDLHETTDSDNTVFRPALQARDGKVEEWSEIPDGFYVVGDSDLPQAEFQKAIIDSVRKVTHIAPPDAAGKIIGAPLEQEGVINYPLKNLGLCPGFSNAQYTTTTEVYPDSPKVTDAICADAQVAAIVGGLDYLLQVERAPS